ncbi:MAG TPA: NUDIX domain-containing protein [Acidimicrobiales bacterium]|jgi:8-oxo-dGTP pyrophosphatase MutT (NUDIX family)
MVRRLHAAALRVFGRLPRPVRRATVRVLAPKFTVGAICVIERPDGRILLVRQSYRRHWGFPGGLLQRREDAELGARREVLEEVGLDVRLRGEPAVVVHARHRRVDVVYRASIDHLDASVANEVAPRSVEITEARWFLPDGLPRLQSEASGALVALARVRRLGPIT